MPSASATGVRLMRFVTSPMAYMPGTLVREYSSTTTAPRPSSLTPTLSSPRAGRAVLGTRPVANMTTSASSESPLSVFSTRRPPGAFSTDFGLLPLTTFTPRSLRFSETTPRTSSSKPRRGRSCRYTSVTSLPRPLYICANSRPMYPEPTTTSRLGNVSRLRASSLVMPSSAPGMSGFTARPPVATTMLSAVRSLVGAPVAASRTCTAPGPTSSPRPSMCSTPAPASSRP
mmetsp:Transcript_14049/g.48388  ORF Transcript_14049/g.48388 Transcript_14049/m.48388 type:complete len:230 (+) Transcript_14049:543-1232(+)